MRIAISLLVLFMSYNLASQCARPLLMNECRIKIVCDGSLGEPSEWNMGDGNTVMGGLSGFSYTYAGPGTYTITNEVASYDETIRVICASNPNNPDVGTAMSCDRFVDDDHAGVSMLNPVGYENGWFLTSSYMSNIFRYNANEVTVTVFPISGQGQVFQNTWTQRPDRNLSTITWNLKRPDRNFIAEGTYVFQIDLTNCFGDSRIRRNVVVVNDL